MTPLKSPNRVPGPPSKRAKLPAPVSVALCSDDGSVVEVEEAVYGHELSSIVHEMLWGKMRIDRQTIRIEYTGDLGYSHRGGQD